ncbi:MAG: 3-dehydroquinate synthase [Phycisphaerae bacterium]|jgi:3-dehydroquinate synthase
MVRLPSRRYAIRIGSGASAELPALIAGVAGPRRVVVITDCTVARFHRAALERRVPSATWIVVPPGDQSKSLTQAAAIYDRLSEIRLGRRDLIVAFGGGMIGDLAGFVAGTWQRGVPFVQVPTTLEAAIDASIGGKTAVNHSRGKNLIGVFHQPIAVLIETDFLATLADRDHVAGLAESVKHAVIRDARFLGWHERKIGPIARREPAEVVRLIERNCRIKAEVVRRDERETGLRAILNYGHTIGHALEHVLRYELRHGECVALGMLAENEVAVARRALPRDVADRIRALLAALGLPQRLPRPLDAAEVAAACRMDKKTESGATHFVLISNLGAPQRVSNVLDEELAAALEVIQPSVGVSARAT